MVSTDFSGYDLGFLADVPILKLIDKNLSLDLIDNTPLIPLLDFSIGYSQLNIGDDIYFVDPAQKDPLPRVARLGYGISAGLKLADQKNALEIIHFDFTVDAEDYLIKRDSLGFSYQHGLGDINIWDNIIGIKGDENVASHAGLKFSLLETADIMTGHIGTQDILQTTNGYGIRLKGLLKFISNQSDNTFLNFIAGHFDLRYYHSEYLTHTPVETEFNGLEILFSDFVIE